MALLLLCLATRAANAAPQRVAIFPFEGTGIEPQLLQAAAEGLAVFLRDEGFDVVSATLEPDEEAGLGPARRAALDAGAALFVTGRIVQLGKSAIVQIGVYDLQGETPIWTDRLTTPAIDDLGPALERLAKGIVLRRKAERIETAGDALRGDPARPRSKVGGHRFGLTLGGAVPLGDETSFFAGGSAFWLFDARKVLFDISGFHFGFNTDGYYFGGSIGAYYPLSEASIAPYAGGGLELTSFQPGYYTGGRDGSGLSAFAAVGGLAGRASSVVVRVELRWVVTTYDAGDGVATAPVLSAGVAF